MPWKALIDEIPGPGIPLYVPMLAAPDGAEYRYRALKSYDEAREMAERFASGLNDGKTSIVLLGWRRIEKDPAQ